MYIIIYIRSNWYLSSCEFRFTCLAFCSNSRIPNRNTFSVAK